MLPVTIPSTSELTELTEHRDEASVSIYLPSSPRPIDVQATRLSLKNATKKAVTRLEGSGYDARRIATVIEPIAELDSDLEFWQHQGQALGILAGPGRINTFRLMHEVPETIGVGDRFDVGPLLRSLALANGGYALTVTEGYIRFYGLATGSRPIALELDLPDDLHTVLEHADNFGHADRGRAKGAHGEKNEQQRYCRLVQDAVLQVIGDNTLPLVLAASAELEPAYRAINRYAGLMAEGITAHPESLTPDELDKRAKAILDGHYRADLKEWRERFGTQRSQGLATSKLDQVARAATAAVIAELHFDVESTLQGTIDDQGVVHKADAPGPGTYGVVDEIAVRVLRSGGSVTAVRNNELMDGSPVAAILRYPL